MWTGFLYGTTYFQLHENFAATDDGDTSETDYRYRISMLGTIVNLLMVAHSQDLTEIEASRVFTVHELSSHKYSPLASWASYSLFKALFACVNTFLYSLLVYELAGLHGSTEGGGGSYFLYFTLILILTDLFAIFQIIAVYNFSPSIGVSIMFYLIVIGVEIGFEGFIFYLPNFGAWISWVAFINCLRYAFQGVILNEFHYNTGDLPEANNYIHELGFEGLSRGSIVVILLCMLLGMMFLSCITYRPYRFLQR